MSASEHGAGRHAITTPVRWDDCDRYGHLNNAAYVALARLAHDSAGMPGTRLVEFEISYRAPVPLGARLSVSVARESGGDGANVTSVDFAVAGDLVATARAAWDDGPDGDAPRHLPPTEGAGGRWFRHDERVRTYHLGPDGRLRPQVVLQWFEHAVFRAAEVAGWPLQRMDAAGFVSLVVGHRLALGPGAREGDRLAVSSRLVDVRRVSGTWLHELRSADGSLIAADHARGAFLDPAGRLRPAPAGLIEDLLAGEPDPAGDAGS